MKAICVAPDYVDQIWPHVAGFINQALARGNAEQPIEYTYLQLKRQAALLWVVWDGKTILAAAVTEIVNPVGTDKRHCMITACGGQSLKLWLKFLDRIEQYARDENCEKLRIYGRPGWLRILHDRGYEQPWVALEKRL